MTRFTIFLLLLFASTSAFAQYSFEEEDFETLVQVPTRFDIGVAVFVNNPIGPLGNLLKTGFGARTEMIRINKNGFGIGITTAIAINKQKHPFLEGAQGDNLNFLYATGGVVFNQWLNWRNQKKHQFNFQLELPFIAQRAQEIKETPITDSPRFLGFAPALSFNHYWRLSKPNILKTAEGNYLKEVFFLHLSLAARTIFSQLPEVNQPLLLEFTVGYVVTQRKITEYKFKEKL